MSTIPGPWWVVDNRRVDPRTGRRNGEGLQVNGAHRGEGYTYCIASINFWEDPEGHARLIAAAPELLAALQALYNESAGPPPAGATIEMAKAAIRKATEG